MSNASLTEQLDAQVSAFFSTWNIYTTVIAVALAALVLYPLIINEEPDTHPLLLARQGRAAPVRQPNESAVYRSNDVPHGYPLRSGLNVRDADTPRYGAGRDGDLRDIWRLAVAGGENGEKGLLMTVHGKESSKDHDLADVTLEINAIGQHLATGGTKLAIYLPNCLEYLAAVFAASFHGLPVVLLPFNLQHQTIIDLIHKTNADCLVAAAGSLPLELLDQNKINNVVWVVPESSRQMDWSGDAAKVKTTAWHDVTATSKAGSDLPASPTTPPTITQVWMTQSGMPGKIIEFKQSNIIAAVAGLGTALPPRQRLSTADLVLPADHFSNLYVLCNVLAALHSHASIAFNSVAGQGVDLKLASRSISPTVIIASAETLANMHSQAYSTISNGIQKIAHVSQAQAMTSGRMPTDTLIFKLLGPRGSTGSATPGQLRLIMVAERAGGGSPALSSNMLSDLRIFTRSRIVYALTAADVAGAVSQTNLYDYRMDEAPQNHFGVPLSCCEIKLISKLEAEVDGLTPTGEIVVIGPSVINGEARLGVQGQIREDATLAYS